MRGFPPRFLLLGLLTLNSPMLNAQWVQTNGPYGRHIRSLAVSGTNLFAGNRGGGVFRSTHNGATRTNGGYWLADW